MNLLESFEIEKKTNVPSVQENDRKLVLEINRKLLGRLEKEDFDEVREIIISSLSEDVMREEDVLLLVQYLLPQVLTHDGKIIPFHHFHSDNSKNNWNRKLKDLERLGKFVYFPRTEEAIIEFLTRKNNFTPKVTLAIAEIVRDTPAFRMLSFIIRTSSESVYTMKLQDPRKMHMYIHQR